MARTAVCRQPRSHARPCAASPKAGRARALPKEPEGQTRDPWCCPTRVGTMSPLRQGLAMGDVVVFVMDQASSSWCLDSQSCSRGAARWCHQPSCAGARGPWSVPFTVWPHAVLSKTCGPGCGAACRGVIVPRCHRAVVMGTVRGWHKGAQRSVGWGSGWGSQGGCSGGCRGCSPRPAPRDPRPRRSLSPASWPLQEGSGAGTSAPPRFIIEFNLQSSLHATVPGTSAEAAFMCK